MALLFYSEDDDPAQWSDALRAQLPDLDVRVYPEFGTRSEIDCALVWKPPPGMLSGLPGLRAIFSLGAGVDAMLGDPTLPDLPLCRMVDRSLTVGMAEFVQTLVLAYHRSLDTYLAQQARKDWRLIMPTPASSCTVGIMGLGELGGASARVLASSGFRVRGWSRTARKIEGVEVFVGPAERSAFLSGTDILVCLLPLTADTEGILNAALFAQLPRGARLINVARGRHLVEADLVAALDEGSLAHAALDVFEVEPLPPGNPLWTHPKVWITPHSASYSLPESGAVHVASNIRRLRAGQPLMNVVDRERGY